MNNSTTQKLSSLSVLLAFWLIPVALFSQVFYDGFESGTYLPTWTNGAGAYTRTVTTVAPGAGTYAFQLDGGFSSHYNGIIGSFSNTQASEISWMVKGPNNAHCGYVVIGDANVTSNNGMVFSRITNVGDLNFYATAGIQFDYPVSSNVWYLVELKNIDWANKNFDIFIDGVLQYPDFPFRDPNTAGVSQLHFYNFNSATAYLDEVNVMGIGSPCTNPTIPTLTYSPNPVCFGDNATLNINGILNDATAWYIYSGGCNGTLLGSTASSSFVVTPPALGETYYVRGEDGPGCVNETSGICSPIVVDIDNNGPVPDASFLFDVIDLCSANPSVPTATDNCTGAVVGVPNVSLPVTTLGASTIIWTFTDGDGYTSTQSQNVIVVGVDITTSANGTTLSSNNPNATYQWIDCATNLPIAGATNQSYTALSDGNYAVIVTEAGCSDTSACMTVNTIGIKSPALQSFVLYPNPSKDGMFSVKFDGEITAIEVVDMLGRTIEVSADLENGVVNASNLTSGKYMLRISVNDQILQKGFVIQK